MTLALALPMTDEAYSNRELDEKFKKHEEIDLMRFNEVKEDMRKEFAEIKRLIKDLDEHKITPIKLQTEKTNGRVTKLEGWRWFVMGGLAIISLMIVPLALAFVISRF